MKQLAVHGGTPVGRVTWPRWPEARAETLEAIREVLYSGRWAISGTWQGKPSAEATFARMFADFNEVPYCVPTTNGTSALVCALEALDIGAGDEVIIPGMTWVANASTVLAVNATPIIVDIDPATLCLAPAAVEAAITERTRAIVIVHLYSSLADLDAIDAIAKRHGLAVIEDCAQAHGARWNGSRVGTIGAIGTFSMQQTKLLTAGEGGAAICTDEALHDRLFQLRSDGRRAIANPGFDEMELAMDSSVSGSNFCLSEFSAAVLCDQLTLLEAQNKQRALAASIVDSLLEPVEGVQLIRALPGVTERTFYYYTFRVDRAAFGGVPASTICRALAGETGLPFQPTYPPMHLHPLYRPQTKRRFQLAGTAPDRLEASRFDLAEAVRAHDEVLTIHHSVLLADPAQFALLPEAIAKVQAAAAELIELDQAGGGGFENPL